MSDIERLTITLPAAMAAVLKKAVSDGDYASTSEVVREALRDWRGKRQNEANELNRLRQDIDRGLADLTAGRVKDFDIEALLKRGRALSAARSD